MASAIIPQQWRRYFSIGKQYIGLISPILMRKYYYNALISWLNETKKSFVTKQWIVLDINPYTKIISKIHLSTRSPFLTRTKCTRNIFLKEDVLTNSWEIMLTFDSVPCTKWTISRQVLHFQNSKIAIKMLSEPLLWSQL